MKNKIFFFFLAIQLTCTLGAKAQKLDSLLRELNTNAKSEDTFRFKLLDSIIWYYESINIGNGIQYADKEIMLAQKLPEKKYLAEAYTLKGNTLLEISDFLNALEYYQKSSIIYESIGDKISTGFSFLRIGDIMHFHLSTDSIALDYYKKALMLEQNADDKEMVSICFLRIAYAYSTLSNETKAIEYSQRALAIQKNIHDAGDSANALNDAAGIYVHFHNYQKALDYYDKALSIYKIKGNKQDMTMVLGNIGEVYKYLSDYNKALEYQKKALELNKLIGNNVGISDNYSNISDIYLKQKKYQQAILYARLTKTLSTRIGTLDNQEGALEVLSNAYGQTKQYEKAYKIYKQYIIIKDSINNTEKQKKITQLQMQYDFDKKEDSLKLQQILRDEKLKQSAAINRIKQHEQWSYIIGSLVLLGLGVFYFFYRTRVKENRLKTEIGTERILQQKKEAEFQRNIADVSLTALRSQMNPHFIFNCLNSIKLYTSQNDTTAAVEYLTKFSKLIRLVMENSHNDRISLSSELQALRLYIEMEAMRFKEKLKYSINVGNNVEVDYIEIPPLLLQPYVENAIWHGLMHKEEGGKIDVNVAMKTTESLLEINIIDNGIGRARSAELKSKTATIHKSYGMKVTQERIALINQIYKAGANVTIHDLIDAEGNLSGTRVTIQIPV